MYRPRGRSRRCGELRERRGLGLPGARHGASPRRTRSAAHSQVTRRLSWWAGRRGGALSLSLCPVWKVAARSQTGRNAARPGKCRSPPPALSTPKEPRYGTQPSSVVVSSSVGASLHSTTTLPYHFSTSSRGPPPPRSGQRWSRGRPRSWSPPRSPPAGRTRRTRGWPRLPRRHRRRPPAPGPSWRHISRRVSSGVPGTRRVPLVKPVSGCSDGLPSAS
jgi:hypothetical protein